MSFDHTFEAPIVRHSMGTNAKGELFYTVVFVPPEIVSALPGGGPIRIVGEVAEMPVKGALMPTAGRRYLVVPKGLMRERGLGVEDEVEVRFSLTDPDAVDIPEALCLAVHAENEIADAWDALTPGKQRALAYRVDSAKRADTRDKRVAEIVSTLRAGRDPTARR